MFEAEREQIRKRIEERVSEHWDATNKVILLAQLGARIKKEFPNANAVMEMKFRDFARTCTGIRLIEHPLVDGEIGAIPAGVKIPENVVELFEEKTGAPYFSREFWRAFHTPLTGKRFAVPSNLIDPPRIIEGELSEGVEGYEIFESDVCLLPANVAMPEKVRAVADSIRAWLKRNNLARHQFRGAEGQTAPAQELAAVQEEVSVDVKPKRPLSEALADLHPSDQARISIPLDIVLKMLSQRQ